MMKNKQTADFNIRDYQYALCGDSLSNYSYCHCGARLDGEQND